MPANSQISALRDQIARIESGGKRARGVLPFGIEAVDRKVPGGGLALGALHEVAGGGNGAVHGSAAALFAAVAAKLQQRYTWPEGLTLWSLSLPQLAATLAAAVTAYTPVDANGARLIDETVINAVIVLMTVTAILGPLFTQRFGQRATPPPTGGDDAHHVHVELNRCQSRTDKASQLVITKADHGEIVRNAIAAFTDGAHPAKRDQVVGVENCIQPGGLLQQAACLLVAGFRAEIAHDDKVRVERKLVQSQ